MLLVLGNIILQLSVVYETESTTSCQYMEIIPTQLLPQVEIICYSYSTVPGL